MAKKYEATRGKRFVSWMLGGMARLGLGNFVVLTTIGRKSGKPRRVTISPIAEGDLEYLVSPYGESAWVLNARADPKATVSRRGKSQAVHLVELTGDRPDLVKAYYEREAFARQFMDVPGEALEDFAAVSERFPLFRMDSR